MPRYRDELDAIVAYERELRGRIARRIADEAGMPVVGEPTAREWAAAEAAIEAWRQGGEDEADPRAFRPTGPLQHLLAEHRAACDRIDDVLDRRLS
ncbi:hypothetical protein [Bosea sp. CS1GBMeth4]|uniref:hypothetical protein n=1 Tax=Bosea sp. CS1GBMeth4 TaxID=1892849 RepID=UPI0016496DBB|nr:hypothetical protein [Bosea sp. CS1GBMeth4]